MLAVTVRDSLRRHLKAEAARLGKDMGSVVEEALGAFLGPKPSTPTDSERSNAA